LLNFVGCALGGAQDEAMGIAVKVLTPFFGPPQGIVIGCGDRPDALNAAFLNAVSANVLEYDDTHLGTVMHPAAPVAPGLFALVGVRCPAANCCRRLFSASRFRAASGSA
jgi:2-methylcitrate dehydratase PrpD